jgi:integrase
MAAFVTSLAEAGKKVATIQRHCASVSKAHQLHGRFSGPLFLSFHKGQRLSRRRLSTFSLNEIVQLRLGAPYTAHSLRASFVTIAKFNGADDAEVMNQTKHKITNMIRRYTRLKNIRRANNAAQKLVL